MRVMRVRSSEKLLVAGMLLLLAARSASAGFAGRGYIDDVIGGIDWQFGHLALPDGGILSLGTSRRFPGLDAAWFTLAKFRANGERAPFFGDDGVVRLRFKGSKENHAMDAVTLANGSLIAIGGYKDASGLWNGVITRHQPDGALDASFGANGVVYFEDLGLRLVPSHLALDSQQRVIVLGFEQQYPDQDRYRLCRLLVDGTLDDQFAGGGCKEFPVPTPAVPGFDLLGLFVQDDDSVRIAGAFFPYYAQVNNVFIAAHQPDGDVDTSFGGGGMQFVPGLLAFVNDVAMHQGKFYFPRSRGVARVTAQGLLDPTFGAGGLATLDPIPGCGSGFLFQGVAIQPNGFSYVSGQADCKDPFTGKLKPRQIAMASFEPDGTVNREFGGAGYFISTFAPDDGYKQCESRFLHVANATRLWVHAMLFRKSGYIHGFGILRVRTDGTLEK